ncbi:hypothetical protein C8J56DRAFT_1040883 [Mycena floridula]|nr:hypothetical protein C8J56DRAFT_1040883 [Mycena floridula]
MEPGKTSKWMSFGCAGYQADGRKHGWKNIWFSAGRAEGRKEMPITIVGSPPTYIKDPFWVVYSSAALVVSHPLSTFNFALNLSKMRLSSAFTVYLTAATLSLLSRARPLAVGNDAMMLLVREEGTLLVRSPPPPSKGKRDLEDLKLFVRSPPRQPSPPPKGKRDIEDLELLVRSPPPRQSSPPPTGKRDLEDLELLVRSPPPRQPSPPPKGKRDFLTTMELLE